MHFKIDMVPPTVTAQQKGVYVKGGKPIFYEKNEVKKARQMFLWYLWRNRPEKPLEGAVFLKTVWIFPPTTRTKPGEYKCTKPDTDNLLKLFKDTMTQAGYWKDDAQVAYEVTAKKYGTEPGIEVTAIQIEDMEGLDT